jgi:signal transduction histidine kinase
MARTPLLILLMLFGIAMCVWVYRANPQEPENRGFPLMMLPILSWVLFYHLAQLGNPTWWFRMTAGAVFVFFVGYYYFIVKWFLGKKGRFYDVLGRAILLYGFILGAVTVGTDLVISGSTFVGSVARPVFSAPGRWAFYSFVTIVTVFINWILIKAYLAYPKERRLRIQYFFIGMLLFAGCNIVFNVALPLLFDVYEYYEIGNYSVVFLLGFTAYAVVKQELFGIRTVLTTLFVGAIGLLLAIDMLGFTEGGALQVFKGAVLLLFLYFGYLLVQSVRREIAHRKQVEEIAAELRRSDEAKTEFLSIVSHQLRTPLNAIAGYLSLLLEGAYGKLDDKKQKPVERLYRSNKRLIHLVQELLGVSRLQMGRIELELEEVDLCKVAKSVVEEFSVAADEKGIELSATCPEGGVPLVEGDAQKLRDSILNLVDNAIRYTNEGSVHVSVNTEDSSVVVRVKDTGPGIEPGEMKALFESFQRGEVGRRHWAEGSGLGLYIAQEFVGLHGGRVWAESAGKGKGSTFCIRVPLRRGELAA